MREEISRLSSENIALKRALADYKELEYYNNKHDEIAYLDNTDGVITAVVSEMQFDTCYKLIYLNLKIMKIQKGTYEGIKLGSAYCDVKDNVLFIVDFGIQEPYRRKGYGTRLIDVIKKYAKQLSIKCVKGQISFVDKTENMPEAFYKSCGFEIKGNTVMYNVNE